MGTVNHPLLASALLASMALSASSLTQAAPAGALNAEVLAVANAATPADPTARSNTSVQSGTSAATNPSASAHVSNSGANTGAGAHANSSDANTSAQHGVGHDADAANTDAEHGDDSDAATRASRWQALQKALFPGRSMQDGAGIVKLDAPPRAMDAALVPLTIDLSGVKPVKGVYVVIDNNPSPLAAHFTFGPKADPRSLKLRVRVDAYTNMHAIAESQDGHLFVSTRFVKASGGCSAPAGADDSAALADIGRMKLHLIGDFTAGKPEQAVLMVRHPNFNGMQMNQITRYYTPPRFIRTIDASYEGASIFHLDSDISMSTDPVITFGFVPQAKGQLKVVVKDSKDATFDHSFDVPGGTNAVADANAPGA